VRPSRWPDREPIHDLGRLFGQVRYIRHCYDGCDGAEEMDQMREELRRMVEMFAAAGKIATTDWETLPPPI